MKNRYLLFIAALSLPCLPALGQADWVHAGPDGRLVYKTDAIGNRIMDFSTAGYMAGGIALPAVPVKVTLTPSGGDDRAAIQNAINQVAALPMANGFRGAVLLGPGTFRTSGTVGITASGVVLRGSGSGAGGTSIIATGGSLFRIAGSGNYAASGAVNISDAVVPSGSMSLSVSSAAGFSVGDNVLITKTVTASWVAHMGMDQLVRDGAKETWIATGTKITTDRTITAITGNKLTFDAPITDNFESQYLGSPVGTVAKYSFGGRISQSGIEHLKITAPANANSFSSMQISAAMDCWVRDLIIQDGTNVFGVEKNVRRVTIDGVIINHTVASTNAALPADFDCVGTQILFNNCESNGKGSWCWTTGGEGTGPMVVLNFKSTQNTGISPHMRWTTGILSDGAALPNAPKGTQGISYRNRTILGSGHGWTTGWSVAWNVTTPYFLVSNAPGTINWAIGGIGTKTSTSDPDGVYDHFNTMVSPKSLYLQQLQERLGPQALANIGYGGAIGIRGTGTETSTHAFQASVSGSDLLYTFAKSTDAMVTLYGTNGAKLKYARIEGRAGRNTVKLDELGGTKTQAGIYFVNLSIAGESRTFAVLIK